MQSRLELIGGGRREKRKVSLVGLERLISPRTQAQTDANKQAGHTGIFIFLFRQLCRWHNKPGQHNSVASHSCSCTDIFAQMKPPVSITSSFFFPVSIFLVWSRNTKHCLLIPSSFSGCWWGCCHSHRGENAHTFAYLLLSPVHT